MSGAPIAINGRAAVRREVGGVERWARELSERLPLLRPGGYRVVAPPAALAHRAGQVWEQALLPLATRQAPLILSPANLAPLASRRNVVVIHDAAPLRGPEWYGRTYGRWHRLLLPRISRGARLVLVPSAFVADELERLLGLPAHRLRVISPGADAAPLHAGSTAGGPTPAAADPSAGSAEAASPAADAGAKRPYVLAVGTDSARKNLALLDAIAPTLAAEGLAVVIAGSTRGYLRAAPAGAARRLGYVPEAALPQLYANARVLAMPSLYEGFGLPCVEAMAAGVPVVAANRAALPETCGDAALLIDPADPDAFAAALLRAAYDQPLRERLTAAGRARAARFTWRRTAEQVDATLRELLEQA